MLRNNRAQGPPAETCIVINTSILRCDLETTGLSTHKVASSYLSADVCSVPWKVPAAISQTRRP